MILVDSSVWIDHLRAGEPVLIQLLNAGRVLSHPFVVGELACGNLKNRETVLSLLQALPAAPVATDQEVLFYIARHNLMGKGLGYVDAHLLSSTSLAGSGRLWTRDKRLGALARSMGLAFDPASPPTAHEPSI
jgi:predicted nucleic acid-binding protein